jgi:hypothetical protein
VAFRNSHFRFFGQFFFPSPRSIFIPTIPFPDQYVPNSPFLFL